MPLTLGLDKSRFNFRKSDRTSFNVISIDRVKVKSEEFDVAPALPPLESLNKKSSFGNLLDQLESSIKANASETSAQTPSKLQSQSQSQPQPQSRSQSLPPTEKFTSNPEPPLPVHQEKQVQHVASVASPLMASKNTASVMSLPEINTGMGISVPQHLKSTASLTSQSEQGNALSTRPSSMSLSSNENVPNNGKAREYPLNSSRMSKADVKSRVDSYLSSMQNVQNSEDAVALRHERSASMFIPTPNIDKPLPLKPAHSPAVEKASATKKTRANLPSQVSLAKDKKVARLDQIKDNEVASFSKRPLTIDNAQISNVDTKPSAAADTATFRFQSLRAKAIQLSVRNVSSDMAERVILLIMQNLDSLSDLKATALVSKGFYHVFRRYETDIVERVLVRASLPVWELRQLIMHEQKRNSFRMKSVQGDLAAMTAIRAFILMKCNKSCRKSTVDGLMGNDPRRRIEVENALWRIWIFCKLFGKGSSRDSSIPAQMFWLQSKIRYEHEAVKGSMKISQKKGFSMHELEDINEMWCCLEVLLSGFRGRENEARQAGIFDQCHIDETSGKTETFYLEEWIFDILSVGPKAVLTLISCSFEHAKVLGVTKWTPPRHTKSRRLFMRAALEQVYRERLVANARLQAETFAKSMQQNPQLEQAAHEKIPLISLTAQMPSSEDTTTERIQQSVLEHYGYELDDTQIKPEYAPPSVAVAEQIDDAEAALINAATISSLTMTTKASTRLGATLFPGRSDSESEKSESEDSVHNDEIDVEDAIDLYLTPKVVDPTDRAVSLLVKQLGFPMAKAKHALAMSDDGCGIDVQKAIALLSAELKLPSAENELEAVELPVRPSSQPQGTRQSQEFCEGTCRRVSLIDRNRSKVRGILSRNSIKRSFTFSGSNDEDKKDSSDLASLSSDVASAANSDEAKSGHPSISNFIKTKNGLKPQHSISSQYSVVSGHRKSSSVGTIEAPRGELNYALGPVSPSTPTATAAHIPQSLSTDRFALDDGSPSSQGDKDDDSVPAKQPAIPTRVGTSIKPSKVLSLSRQIFQKEGNQPEIIGYTFSNKS